MLNLHKPNNYAFFCPVSKVHLTVSSPVGFASEVTPAILRAVKANTVIDVEGVIDLETGNVGAEKKQPAQAEESFQEKAPTASPEESAESKEVEAPAEETKEAEEAEEAEAPAEETKEEVEDAVVEPKASKKGKKSSKEAE